MAFTLIALLLAVFVAVIAMTGSEGLWGNIITLFNVAMAGLVAMNFFEPLAVWIDGMQPRGTYLWDFVSLWLVFGVTLLILREITRLASQVKVRFPKLVETIGGYVGSALIGWVMVAFTLTTLHTAPLARTAFGGGFQPENRMFLGFAPDRQWLGFVQRLSTGAFARGSKFDPDPDKGFLMKYATRRKYFETQQGLVLDGGQ